jgi:V8-like Glu-specific endopeptidase
MREAVPADLRLGDGRQLVRAGPAEAARATDTSSSSSSFPGRVHGKAFFTVAAGSEPGDYVCSGTVVASNSHDLAWTAGHCVDDAEFGGGFATNWSFVPGYLNGEAPFGEWPAKHLRTTSGWESEANTRVDLGAATLARDGQGRGVEDVVGARGIAFDKSRNQQLTAFGYPAMPTLFEPLFDGERLYSCESAITGSDNPPGSGPETMQIDCDMSGGSSGGGWVNADGDVDGLTSYGYAADFTHLFGPYFGSTAKDLYTKASGPPLLCAGTAVTNLGGSPADSFSGSTAADVFSLKGGDDRAAGDAGDDSACGGGGNDSLLGADGADTLLGGSGADLLVGGPGVDTCVGGPGRDHARGCEARRQIP